VAVGREALAGGDAVLVDDAQGAEAHVPRVVIIGEREGVVGVEPAVVGVATFVGASDEHGREHGDGRAGGIERSCGEFARREVSSAATSRSRRYWPGVTEKAFLKWRVRWAWSAKPTRAEASAISRAGVEQGPRGVHPQEDLVGVRRDPEGVAEHAREVILADAVDRGELVEADGVGEVGLQVGAHGRQLATHAPAGVRAAIAVLAEREGQQLAQVAARRRSRRRLEEGVEVQLGGEQGGVVDGGGAPVRGAVQPSARATDST
jgi:hypothetical protein